jgi:hypothetical protein
MVREDRRFFRVQLEAQIHVPLAKLVREQFCYVPGTVVDRGRLGPQIAPPGEIEEVGHGPFYSPQPVVNEGQVTLAHVAVLGLRPHVLDAVQYARERIVHLVRNPRGERAECRHLLGVQQVRLPRGLRLAGLLQFVHHPVERLAQLPDFVAGPRPDARGEVALAGALHRLVQPQNGPDQPLHVQHRQDGVGQHQQQRHLDEAPGEVDQLLLYGRERITECKRPPELGGDVQRPPDLDQPLPVLLAALLEGTGTYRFGSEGAIEAMTEQAPPVRVCDPSLRVGDDDVAQALGVLEEYFGDVVVGEPGLRHEAEVFVHQRVGRCDGQRSGQALGVAPRRLVMAAAIVERREESGDGHRHGDDRVRVQDELRPQAQLQHFTARTPGTPWASPAPWARTPFSPTPRPAGRLRDGPERSLRTTRRPTQP